MPARSPKPIVYQSLHEQPAVPSIDWLWPAWIPVGMLTILGAAPGVGKSLVALDLARRIIHDGPFPDGAPVPCPGSNVLIVDAEGPLALLNQRVQAWDIDSRNLFPMPPPKRLGMFDLIQPDQITLLGRMMGNIRPALVIVDSLAAAAPRAESSPRITHELLGGLAALAREARTALLVIHHLRKRPSSGWAPAAIDSPS
jgi:predicted ATP-dependent serine protease